jgi:hypothetical protein
MNLRRGQQSVVDIPTWQQRNFNHVHGHYTPQEQETTVTIFQNGLEQ